MKVLSKFKLLKNKNFIYSTVTLSLHSSMYRQKIMDTDTETQGPNCHFLNKP